MWKSQGNLMSKNTKDFLICANHHCQIPEASESTSFKLLPNLRDTLENPRLQE